MRSKECANFPIPVVIGALGTCEEGMRDIHRQNRWKYQRA